MKHPWLITLGVLLALAALWFLLGGLNSRGSVQAQRVVRGPIREFIDEQAKTRLPETFLITMPFAGRIEAIGLTEGTPVRRGEVVARVVPGDLKLEVDQAQAAVRRLEAGIRESGDTSVEQTGLKQALKFVDSTEATVKASRERVKSGVAKVEYADTFFNRISAAVRTGAASASDYDAALLQKLQSRFDSNQDEFVHAAMLAMQAATDLMPTMIREYMARKGLSVDVLQRQKAEADVRLQQVLRDQQRGEVQSPVDGVLLSRLVSSERFLAAGTALLEIGRLEDLEVEAEILTLDVVSAKVGDAVEIYGPAVGKPPARGKVARIYPAGFTKVSSLGVEQQRVMVIVRFEPDDLRRMLAERRLGVGYRVRVRIFTAEKPEALIVPRSALFRSTAGQWQLFAVRNGAAKLQDVEIGLMNDEQVEVLSGLDEGELVVLAPESTLADGTRVRAEVTEK